MNVLYIQAYYSLYEVTQLSLRVGWDTREYRTLASVRKLCSFPWDNYHSFPSWFFLCYLWMFMAGFYVEENICQYYIQALFLSKVQWSFLCKLKTISSWCGHTLSCPGSASHFSLLPWGLPMDIAGHQLSTHIREGELTSQEMNLWGIASFPFLPTGQAGIRCRLYDFLEDGPPGLSSNWFNNASSF